MKKEIEKYKQLLPVSYLYTEVTEYKVSEEKHTRTLIVYRESHRYQTKKYGPMPFYKHIDF